MNYRWGRLRRSKMETFADEILRNWKPSRREWERTTIRKSSSLETPKSILGQWKNLLKRKGCSGYRKRSRVTCLTWTCWSSEWCSGVAEYGAKSQLQLRLNSWSGASSVSSWRQQKWTDSSHVSISITSYRPENILQNNCQFCSLLDFAEMCLPENKCLLRLNRGWEDGIFWQTPLRLPVW